MVVMVTHTVVMVTRLLEREESVKADIFQAYRTLLSVTRETVRVTDTSDSMETSDR